MNFWYQPTKTLAACLLTPFAFLYGNMMRARRALYRRGIFKTISFSTPVIVVGNLTVGGTGKTPLVVALADYLKQQGYRPGLVSRGYGGKPTHKAMMVFADSNPREVGDEAVLLAQKTGCHMVVSTDRVLAVQTLLNNTNCNVVISDDGLQHLAMGRAMEVVVVDAERQFGNGLCLPAGPLREFATSLRGHAHTTVVPRLDRGSQDFKQTAIHKDSLDRHAAFAARDDDTVIPRVYVMNGAEADTANYFAMRLIPGDIQNLCRITVASQEATVESDLRLNPQQVHAVAGIGNPERFFHQLEAAGFQIIRHPFSDHHAYEASDFNFPENLPIVMTEKDAVKCKPFDLKNAWYWPVHAELSAAFYSTLNAALRDFSREKC